MARKSRAKYTNKAERIQAQHYGYPNANTLSVGSRFFFFDSLASEPEGSYGNTVYIKAMDILYSHSESAQQARNNIFDEETIQAALEFLQRAYQQEAANEYRCWNERIMTLFQNTEYEEWAKSCFKINDDVVEIEYINFINLINMIENDAIDRDKWLTQLNQLNAEINEFNNEIKAINNEVTPSAEQLAASGPNRYISAAYKNNFADRRVLSDYTRSMKLVPQLNRALLGSTRSELFTHIKQRMEPIIEQLLQSGNHTVALNIMQKRGYTSEMIREVLKDFFQQLRDAGQPVDLSFEEFDKIMFDHTNNQATLKPEIFDRMLERGNRLLRDLALLEEQGEAIPQTPKDRVRAGRYKSSGPAGLTKQVRERLSVLMDDGKDGVFHQLFDNYKKKNFSDINVRRDFWNDFKKLLDPLLQQQNNAIGQSFLDKEYIDFVNQILSQASTFTVYDETEYEGARKLTNTLRVLKEKSAEILAAKVVGKDLGKTDVSGIIIPLGKLGIDPPQLSQQQVEGMLTNFEDNYARRYQKYKENISKRIYDSKLFKQAKSFSFKAQTQAVKKASEDLAKEISKYNKADTETDNLTEAQRIRKTLEQLIIIDESQKFSEYSFEGFGFKGGSIGANIDEQIANINDIYKTGGITPIDKDWLIFATLNCGNHLLGAGLRPRLEDYFSVVASMLMFRSGGILAQQIRQRAEEFSEANYMRLYSFGPVFVPQSYILHETYLALSDASSQMYRSARGSRAFIHNNVSASDIVEETEGKKGKMISTWAWNATYKQNYPRVSINIQLLGGFLDILDELQKKLNQF